jgi:hypothetical protein
MKKFVISLLACFLIFAGYYVYKNKNRLYNKFKYRNTSEKVIFEDKAYSLSNTVDTTDQVKDLISTVEQLTNLNKKLEEMNNGHVDSIYSLHVIIDSLNNVITSKPKLKIVSHPFEDTKKPTPVKIQANNLTPKKIKNLKNEKNLPIARGRDAIELKEFFTERYDHRR